MQQEQQYYHRPSGAKALALDQRIIIVRYRLLQFLALILSAGVAIGIRIFFGH
jgi:hypothetical protein